MNSLTANSIALHPAFFEVQVLASFLNSQLFYRSYAPRIEQYAKALGGQKKFSQYSHNLLYDIIDEFRKSDRGEALGEQNIPRIWIDDMLAQMSVSGELLPNVSELLPELLERVYARATPDMVACIKGDAFETWFDSTLVEDFARHQVSRDTPVSPEEARENLDAVLNARGTAKPAVTSFSQSVQMPSHVSFDISACPLPKLNKNIGGGFGKGESTIIAGMTGGGKTVMAAQFAMTFALQYKNVLLVTTEQQPHELTPRMLSSHMNVPFSEFRRGGGTSVIPGAILKNPKYAEMTQTLSVGLDKHLKFLNWAEGGGKSVESDLESEMNTIAKDPEDPFPIDILIFDWIGGALTKNSKKDIREVYLNTATCLHELAKKKDIVVIMFAQLNKVQAKGKSLCSSDMLAECKSMADNATNAIYISGIRNNEKDTSESSYKEIQTINVDKARKGKGGSFQVRRDFAYQRFLELNAANGAKYNISNE